MLTAEEAFAVMRFDGAAEDESNVTLRNRLNRIFSRGIVTERGTVVATRHGGSLVVVVR
jgi:hypothetical protein